MLALSWPATKLTPFPTPAVQDTISYGWLGKANSPISPANSPFMINPLILTLMATPLIAGEITVEKAPFRIEHRFSATAIPTTVDSLRLDPLSWTDFTVEKIVDHGSSVKKDDVLISFEREGYERHLEDQKNALAQRQLAYATQELAFSKLKQEVEISLTATRRAKEMADEDLAYFTKTGRPAQEAGIAQQLKKYEFRLDSAKEELKQLKQMYEADDLTEETEEIILERQKISVESAEFDLKEAKRTLAQKLKVTIPRSAESYQQKTDQATIALAKAEKDLPRSLETAKLALTAAQVGLERAKLELERLEKDAALLEWKAPNDGVLFYGGFEDGNWALGELAKTLSLGGKLPPRRSLATVVPGESALVLNSRVAAAVARTLPLDSKVAVTIAGREDLGLTGTISQIDSIPGADKQYGLTVTTEWPEDFKLPASSQANCVAVVYDKDDSIVLPSKALRAGPDGAWSVGIKLADGKTERRVVTRGRVSSDSTEILGGLESGQVVVVPD